MGRRAYRGNLSVRHPHGILADVGLVEARRVPSLLRPYLSMGLRLTAGAGLANLATRRSIAVVHHMPSDRIQTNAQAEKPCGGIRNALAKLLANVW